MSLFLRPATQDDEALLLRWVNDPETLAQKKLTSEPIAAETHRAWLARRLADTASRIWIIESNDRPAGQIRLQAESGVALIDIFVTPDARGNGVAARALTLAFTELPAHFAHSACAEVRRENIASRRLFERLGFALTESSDRFATYRCPLPFQDMKA